MPREQRAFYVHNTQTFTTNRKKKRKHLTKSKSLYSIQFHKWRKKHFPWSAFFLQSIEIMKLIFISAAPVLEYVANLLFHLRRTIPNDIIVSEKNVVRFVREQKFCA